MKPGSRICCIPAIQTLEMHNVGPWVSVKLDFLEGVNIVSGDNGSGKTVLIRSILAAVRNRFPPEYVRSGSRDDAGIRLEFTSHQVSAVSPANIPEVKEGPVLSKGEQLYERLARFVRLRRSFAGYCVVCGDMLELLDEGLYRKALGLLRKLKCQVVIELKRDYPYGGARHFVCYSDSATKSSRVEIFDR